MARTQVLLIEDHPIVRAGCRRVLQGRPDTDVADAQSGAEGLQLCRELVPDVIVLDLKLPDSSGFVVLRQILAEQPDAKVVVFSMYEDPALVVRALETGAKAYVTKSDDPVALVEAVDKVVSGNIHLGAVVAQKLALMNVRSEKSPLQSLTAREIETLELLGRGHSINEIAGQLAVSYRTAANLVAQLRGKLQAPSTAALIKLALEFLSDSTQPATSP
jgi:DNA-binding NarL/FixJ family response regulator